MIVAGILMVFAPFWSTIHIGQINGLVTLGLVLSLYFSETGKEMLAGVCLALAAAMKSSPALLLFYFLAIRRYRIVLSAVLALLVFTLVAWLQFGTPVFTDFLAVLPQISTVIDPHYYNQGSLSMILRLLLYFGVGVPDTLIASVHRLILMALIGISLFTGLLIPPDGQQPRRWLFALLVSLMTISSPLVWYHHGVFILLPLVWLLVHPRPFYFTSGVVILLLIQGEYIYEMQLAAYSNVVFFNFSGLLVVCGQIAMFVVLAIAYWKELQEARRHIKSGIGLEATAHSD